MQGEIATINYAELPALSKAEVSALRKFLAFDVSPVDLDALLTRALGSLHPIDLDHIKLQYHSFTNLKKEADSDLISSDSICVFGTITPENIPFVIEMTAGIAIDLVYRVLATGPDASDDRNNLTPIEEGIFLFLLSLIHEELKNSWFSEISAQLEPFSKTLYFEEYFPNDLMLSRFSFRFQIKDKTGCLNIYIPTVGLSGLASRYPGSQNAFFSLGLERAREFKIPLSAQIAQIDITRKQLTKLEIGDVIIFDPNNIELHDNRLAGQINCHLGNPKLASLRASVSTSVNGNYLLNFDI